jgi:hypothetical protein
MAAPARARDQARVRTATGRAPDAGGLASRHSARRADPDDARLRPVLRRT